MTEDEILAIVQRESSPSLQQQILARLCDDDELRARLERHLARLQPGGVASGRDGEEDSEPIRDTDPTLSYEDAGAGGPQLTGTQLGPYKLLQRIGEGGMGLVYLAEQTEPVRRRVAVKIIKPGMDSRQVLARFEAERQALAMMDHPNIARVLDAGSTDRGLPYFVMELVNGATITDYCDSRGLATAQRLALFVTVCRAVQHAHQKGVIHRDLKPSNILVAEFDGQPVVKVIDFGVAKATGSRLTDRTVYTELGQVIGTLEYMSPEQARSQPHDIDTRSDIYSLGIVLYALLTGETPIGADRLRSLPWDEVLRVIREEEPPRPSLRLRSSGGLRQVADRRGIEPRRLAALLRGDLDWIVMKALEKDRNRRYASAHEFAEDIVRHLSQQPVLAGPPSGLYRLDKFVRRHRSGLLALLALLVALGAISWWVVTSRWQQQQETEERGGRVEAALQQAAVLMATAQASPIGDDAPWDAVWIQRERVEDLLEQGPVAADVAERAATFLEASRAQQETRSLATQIEEVLIRGATEPGLESWQAMEREMRAFFAAHGFDLDDDTPQEIAVRIRDHPQSGLWSDLLELWIGTRGQMAVLGGPKLTAATMQPWAEALYAADPDPVRTGIRRFLYEGPRTTEVLDQITAGVDLSTLPVRTLSWLANVYLIAGSVDRSDAIYRSGLDWYPQDFMFTHDYAYSLANQGRWQEAARIYERCLTIRDDVAGVWRSYAEALATLGETEAAERARRRAEALSAATD